eukprot:GGOE01053800.1.p1 GENE.GGOE01053800.1~~GGOE01053800.1.p1  ORF type:complete len:237 (+),score=40.56 GGOE01053800.1:32-742(+)
MMRLLKGNPFILNRRGKQFHALTEAYALFGLKKNVTAKELSDRYRELAKEHHPDRLGGDENKMKELSAAYEVILKHMSVSKSSAGPQSASTAGYTKHSAETMQASAFQYADFPTADTNAKSHQQASAAPHQQETPRTQLTVETRYWAKVHGTPFCDDHLFEEWVKQNFKNVEEAKLAMAQFQASSKVRHPSRRRTGLLGRARMPTVEHDDGEQSNLIPHVFAALVLCSLWLALAGV